MFTIPEKKEWTIILNKTVKQWGAYSYKEADDVLRFKVKSLHLGEKRETFTIEFANETTKSADLYLVWDHTAVAIKLNTDDDAKIMSNIDELMKGDRRPHYFNAIQYYVDNGKDMNKALAWALEAEKANPTSSWPKLWEARVHLKMGEKKAAITAATEGIIIAKADKDDEYVRLNQAVIIQANN